MRYAVAGLLAVSLLALSACGPARRGLEPNNPDHYYMFLDYAQKYVVYVLAGGCCPPSEAQQWIDFLGARKRLIVQESKNAKWAERFEAIHNRLVLWIVSLRDRGFLTDEQYNGLARDLMIWRGWR